MGEICSKLIIKTPEKRRKIFVRVRVGDVKSVSFFYKKIMRRRSGIFIVNFEQI